ncbi:Uncharacterized conserved protein YecE, DUF72 family [Pseudoxanthobacter soli DSM 19599]|uniref:Uncharacterized conserved protein YecE, DUF72 family n=1 Tax=Pseudoxanthobacter soli DSM 19599 TaxID=1123029 RepID=A0A1M7ZPQ3_9HYPH|nr:DUF72 domain-containing protein [Pseudoxanthobacter soli]SHO66847.1 Uncharacterized conserved protein YecE, DUF72 family [Pseudoxanthobacter soli DSM 19599]
MGTGDIEKGDTRGTGDIRIGISGWTYAPWRGAFYPRGLPRKRELAHAARTFRAIEINGTFYGLQTPDIFARWVDETPDDFMFAVKAPRFMTHIKRLREPEVPLANFLASGVLRLGGKLGPILWQLPPSLAFEPDVLEAFLAALPHDGAAAAERAKRHDDHLKARAWLQADSGLRLRHALEIRHDSFVVPAFVEMLRRHGVALVCADTVEWPRLMDVTADFVYCRLHGSEELYRSGYKGEALDRWAKRVRAWSEGAPPEDGRFAAPDPAKPGPRDVFFFFDNTDKLRAPEDARALMERLGQPVVPQEA